MTARSTQRRACMPVLVALLAALCVTTGCLEVEVATRVGLDGRGTFRQATSIDMAKAKAYLAFLREETRHLAGSQNAEPTEPLVDLDLAQRVSRLRAQPGIREVATTEDVDAAGDRHRHVLSLRFESLGALFASGALEDVDATLARTPEGNWKIRMRRAVLDVAGLPPEGKAARDLLALRRKLLERFKPYWGGLEIVTTLALPTRVIETNGKTGADGRTVTWRVGFDDLADPRRLTQTVTFADAEGLALKPYPPRSESER